MSNENNATIENRSELPPPRFDEQAHLEAQPVMPIPKSGTKLLFEKLGHVFGDGSKSLALIVILGFLTGALIGVSLVRQNTSGPEAYDQALVLPLGNDARQLDKVEVGAYGIQRERTNIRSTGRRSRVANNTQQRAYRFAVIR